MSRAPRITAAAKARYDRRLTEGICARCGDGPAVSGKTLCGACLDYHVEYKTTVDPPVLAPQRRSTESKRRYDRLRARGTCARCGREAPVPGKTIGPICQQYLAEYATTRPHGGRRRLPDRACSTDRQRYDRLIAAGICTACAEQPAAVDRTKCRRCLDQQMTKWRERRAQAALPKPWEQPAEKPLTAYPHKRTTAGDARQALGYCPSAGSIALSFFGRVVSHWHR